MKVLVDQDKCVASGQCVVAAPDVFDQRDDDGIVVVRDEEPPAEQEDVVRQAVLTCPSGALSIVES